jgi:hypothetical protein
MTTHDTPAPEVVARFLQPLEDLHPAFVGERAQCRVNRHIDILPNA